MDTYQLQRDFQQFTRRLRLKEFFYNEETECEDQAINPFRRKSGWAPPPNRDVGLETYVRAVKQDIDQALHQMSKRYRWDNLTSEERKALKSLRSRTDIVIKKADKGSATVVMSREDYIREVRRKLNQEENYRKLDDDPTDSFLQEIRCYLQHMVTRGVMDKETMCGLLPDHPRTSRFYIHCIAKNTQTWQSWKTYCLVLWVPDRRDLAVR